MSNSLPELSITPITRSQQGDAEALLTAQLAEHEIPLSADGVTRAIAEIFVRPERGCILLATQGKVTIGLAFLTYAWSPELAGQTACLEELYVLPAHRGHGVGARLAEEVIAQARVHGCNAVDLQVEHSHARAANLYERLGFRELPRRVLRHDLRGK